jgi:hypothetical protein
MVQRIVKMMGGAYSTGGDLQILATYNGIEFVNGSVPTTVVNRIPAPAALPVPALDELALFETTTEATGSIPVTISVTGGTLFFSNFWMNYSGWSQQRQATDPNVPIDPNDPSTFNWVVTVYPDSYYGDPNTNTQASDGILNLTKNGKPWPWRTNVGNQLGDWTYPIANGETVTFDFFVDPAHVVLVVPE